MYHICTPKHTKLDTAYAPVDGYPAKIGGFESVDESEENGHD